MASKNAKDILPFNAKAMTAAQIPDLRGRAIAASLLLSLVMLREVPAPGKN